MGLPVIYSMNLRLRYEFKANLNVYARDFMGLPAKFLIEKALFLIIRNRWQVNFWDCNPKNRKKYKVSDCNPESFKKVFGFVILFQKSR